MSIDDEDIPPMVQHRLEVDHWLRTSSRHDYDPDEGSVEAEEVMFREGAARRRAERAALAGWSGDDTTPRVDARTFPSAGVDEVELWRHPQEPPFDWPAA